MKIGKLNWPEMAELKFSNAIFKTKQRLPISRQALSQT